MSGTETRHGDDIDRTAEWDRIGHGNAHIDGSSLSFRGPDGERIELIADPLGEMYGRTLG